MGFRHIKKAVFPVAGLGTRFLPLTKDIPKEMMPLIDRPLIHYGVDEAVASGCSEIVFVTGTGKETIYQYFQHSPNLEKLLEQKNAEEEKRVTELAKVYEKMTAEKAATVLGTLDQELAIALLAKMKTKSAAKILNNMERDKAAKLTTGFSTLETP